MGRLLVGTRRRIVRRYWIEPEQKTGDEIRFDGELFHHIFDVCRQDVGSKFEVILPGEAYLVEVQEVGKKSARATVIEKREITPLAKPYVNLAICVPRFNVLESVLEKAVEMGVHEIQLLSSDFSFIKKTEKISPNKWERWEKIIRSSTQQSGRGELMQLHAPVALDAFIQKLTQNPPFLCLFGYEGSTPLSIKEFFQQSSKQWEETWILVGAEGGFSHQEVEKLKSSGVMPVTLGSQILRVETACLALTSVLKYEMGLMRGQS